MVRGVSNLVGTDPRSWRRLEDNTPTKGLLRGSADGASCRLRDGERRLKNDLPTGSVEGGHHGLSDERIHDWKTRAMT